jgi:hypothetical protein
VEEEGLEVRKETAVEGLADAVGGWAGNGGVGRVAMDKGFGEELAAEEAKVVGDWDDVSLLVEVGGGRVVVAAGDCAHCFVLYAL